jgi:hypothetical protein
MEVGVDDQVKLKDEAIRPSQGLTPLYQKQLRPFFRVFSDELNLQRLAYQ